MLVWLGLSWPKFRGPLGELLISSLLLSSDQSCLAGNSCTCSDYLPRKDVFRVGNPRLNPDELFMGLKNYSILVVMLVASMIFEAA